MRVTWRAAAAEMKKALSKAAKQGMKQFNIPLEDVQSNIDATNFHYGGQLPRLGRFLKRPLAFEWLS